MAIEKKGKNKSVAVEESKADSLWRKPITLDAVEDEDDPLATLYRGRKVGKQADIRDAQPRNVQDEPAEFFNKKSESSEKPEETKKSSGQNGKKTNETPKNALADRERQEAAAVSSKITESELKDILKIKSETFHFTDIREILRGKSFDIYAYLRLLSADEGICKIKHLDLMKRLDISRPTLFKQGEWLTRLSLIEKRSVPGDHLGTSYTVHRLEDVLPVSDVLVKQLESHIENLRQTVD